MEEHAPSFTSDIAACKGRERGLSSGFPAATKESFKDW